MACRESTGGKRWSQRSRPRLDQNCRPVGRLRCRVGWWSACGWGSGMPAPSGQIPPPWAWWENEASHHEGHGSARPRLLAMGLAPLLLSRATRARCGRPRATVWIPATRAAGVEGLRFHDLRHTAATLAVAAGASTRELRVLGHSSSAAALRYQHVMAGRDAAIAAALDELVQAASARSEDSAAAGSGTRVARTGQHRRKATADHRLGWL